MSYTLGQAAKAVGMSKTSILRSIKAGRISAGRDELGQWAIEPCELHRVYPPLTDDTGTENGTEERCVTGGETALAEANTRATLAEARLSDFKSMLDDMAQWRNDLEQFIAREAIESCIDRGVHERSPMPGVTYFGFTDPAGGSGQDAMTLAICHLEDSVVVLDCLRERRPPFNPSDTASEFIETLKDYGITIVHGDRFAGEWCRQPFRDQGVFYKLSEKDKSALYRDALPILNSRRVVLLDNRTLIGQLCALERSTGQTGRDRIDHPRGAHDDLANVAAGAICIASQKRRRFEEQCEIGLPILFENGVMITCYD
jgi:hypothetical protein